MALGIPAVVKQGSLQYARGWLTSLLVLSGGTLIVLAVFAVQNPLLKVILLAIGCNLPQITFVLSSAIVAEIMPAGQRSSMMSINSALATTGGLVAPALMGAFIQGASTPALGYDKGFVVAGVLCIVTSVIGLLLINPEASKRRFARLYRGSTSLFGEQCPAHAGQVTGDSAVVDHTADSPDGSQWA